MNKPLPIRIPHDAIADFCRAHSIQKLFLFGSVLTEKFRSESDVDVLVEFIPGKSPGFFGLSQMEMDLSEILERRVDLRTPKELSRYFRDEVLSSARLEYAQS